MEKCLKIKKVEPRGLRGSEGWGWRSLSSRCGENGGLEFQSLDSKPRMLPYDARHDERMAHHESNALGSYLPIYHFLNYSVCNNAKCERHGCNEGMKNSLDHVRLLKASPNTALCWLRS